MIHAGHMPTGTHVRQWHQDPGVVKTGPIRQESSTTAPAALSGPVSSLTGKPAAVVSRDTAQAPAGPVRINKPQRLFQFQQHEQVRQSAVAG